ncbi:MAG TPA: DUF4173 domain-containing protein [Nocardioides sp.]|uniref:DUF4153 domain-containing protein n=1 Tax=Nocardioides sp. TaxID=35761 RepID=UPI002D7EF88E|nr:DUF4173 domain-containing protein [Nocardioides sp.]HET6652489.1 DUF4173 domain-containing protein [Nocardioides sp.]
MTTPAVPVSSAPPALDSLFGDLWPDAATRSRPRVLAAALGVGLVAALVLPYRDAGVGTTLVLLAVGGTAFAVSRRTTFSTVCFGLAVALVAMFTLRDAVWIGVLSLLAAAVLGCVALVDARTVGAMLAAGFAPPLAVVRGLPWLNRTVRGAGRLAELWPALRTAGLSLLLLVVFGALFASADALFAEWADAVVPDLSVDSLALRAFVLVAVGAATLAASYVAINPPRVERLSAGDDRPVERAFEWLVPVGLVLALYVGFVAAQATVMFGGHDYLRRTTGLTYAEHVHQGFGQMTVATVLTLAVVAVAARKAPRQDARQRLLLRLVLGALCVLTLVVVASALYRMNLYEDTYGLTQLRLLVAVFEGWLGLVVLLVMAAGLRLHGRWLPRAVVLTGAATLLGLGILNPDGYVAGRNVQRYVETGKADWSYLGGLSADAVPALQTLPADAQACVLGPVSYDDDWLEWNLGRSRAGDVTPDAAAGCPSE